MDTSHALMLSTAAFRDAIAYYLDGSKRYNMVSPNPSIRYERLYPSYRLFRVDFYLYEEALPKFVQDQLSLMLLAVLSTVNYYISAIETEDDEKSDNADESALVSSADRYLQTVAAIVLTAVFLVPEVYGGHIDGPVFSSSTVSILLIFFALSLSSIPPSLSDNSSNTPNGIGIVPLVGVILLWVSFVLPFNNLYFYLTTRKRRAHVQDDLVGKSDLHPFVQTDSFFGPKSEHPKFFDTLAYCSDEAKSSSSSSSSSSSHHDDDDVRSRPFEIRNWF